MSPFLVVVKVRRLVLLVLRVPSHMLSLFNFIYMVEYERGSLVETMLTFFYAASLDFTASQVFTANLEMAPIAF